MIEVIEMTKMDTVTIPRREYEELVRNSENLRDIERIVKSDKYDPKKNMILALCGMRTAWRNTPCRRNRSRKGPETCR